MRKIQNTDKFRGFGETSWETGGVSDAYSGNQDLIIKANSVPLSYIFRFYGLRIGNNNKAICPFSSHSNGREKTPSFIYYPETNSFNCFGCGIGGAAVRFVSNMDNCKPLRAADKILSIYGSDLDDKIIENQKNYSETVKLYMEFSDHVYEFIQKNFNNSDAIKYVEKATQIFDEFCNKKDISNKTLESIIFKLKNLIDRYSHLQQ